MFQTSWIEIRLIVLACVFLSVPEPCSGKQESQLKQQVRTIAGSNAFVTDFRDDGLYVSLFQDADESLVRLAAASEEVRNAIRHLSIQDKMVSARGAAQLDKLVGLTHLSLTFWKDEWSSQLTDMKSLTHLWIQDLDLSGETLSEICKLETLEVLMADGNNFDRESTQGLKRLVNLRQLALSGSKEIGDSEIIYLTTMRKLSALFLSDTSVSDKGVNTLGRCKSLRLVVLDDTLVTKAGVDLLNEQIPQAFITYGPQEVP